MQKLNEIFEDSYVLCLCEGGAVISIMNMLVNSNKLIFNKEDLIQKKVHPRMKVRKVESKFLNKRYSKSLVILRIIDSSREQFNLKKQYRGRFSKVKCLTKPEIEILVIIDKDELEEFYKVKSKQKRALFVNHI